MQAEEPLSETREEITADLVRAMHYTNDLIKRAAYAGLAVDVMTLKMYGAGGVIPQLSFAVRPAAAPTNQPEDAGLDSPAD